MSNKDPVPIMTECVIYQTLEDRDNYDEVEECGPFPCCSSNAWLGKGCYFWDDEIIVAHAGPNNLKGSEFTDHLLSGCP